MKRILRAIFFYFSPFLTFTIKENSMVPLYYPGDIVLVSKLSYLYKKPQTGDTIVLVSPDNMVYLLKTITDIQNGQYFVLGKNKKESVDSRKFGWITKKEIVGKVIYKISNS